MVNYTSLPNSYIKDDGVEIANFIGDNIENIDHEVVQSFGEEWKEFNYFSNNEIELIGSEYFDIVTQNHINENSLVLDVGCGSGRWSIYLSSKVKYIEAIEPSEASLVAYKFTKPYDNIRITRASIADIPFPDESFDFIICLGVLHHIPDTVGGLKNIFYKLKKEGSLLLYLYYNLDGRSFLFRWIFYLSTLLRNIVCKFPHKLKLLVCNIIAIFIYLPFINLAKVIKFIFQGKHWYKLVPLSYYVGKSFKIVRNDSLDRFGTKLEKRYNKTEIEEMLHSVGFLDIEFSHNPPYWHCIARKK